MNDRNVGAGVLTMACSGLAAFFIVRMFLRALANGFSPGRVGAIHAAGTTQYTVFLVTCGVGLIFAAVLFYMGLRWAVLNKGDRT